MSLWPWFVSIRVISSSFTCMQIKGKTQTPSPPTHRFNIFFGFIPRYGRDDQSNSICNILRNFCTIFHVDYIILPSLQQCAMALFSDYICQPMPVVFCAITILNSCDSIFYFVFIPFL